MIQNVISFFAGFFREDRPESFSRGITFVIVAFVLGWDTAYLRMSRSLPDVLVLAAQTAFMTAFYFGGKGIGAYMQTRTPQAPPDPPKGN